MTANAQDAISSITRESKTTKPVFAVFDVRPSTADAGAIQDAIAAAFRVHYDGIKVNQVIAPYPLPAAPGRMSFSQQGSWLGTVSYPSCVGATSIITGSDSSMAKYGEISILQGCVFSYRDGVRVNVYALFGQMSGGSNTNILGAMLGRAISKAVGLGDSSKFIDKTVDDIDERLRALGSSVAMVELQPPREGKIVAADPAAEAVAASHMAPAPSASAPTAVATLVGMQPMPDMQGTVPPQLVQTQLAMQQAVAQQRAHAAQRGTPTPSMALAARKELTGMGLTYYSQDQFVEAVKRNGNIAVALFLQASGVDVNTPDKTGTSAASVTKNPEMVVLLKRYTN